MKKRHGKMRYSSFTALISQGTLRSPSFNLCKGDLTCMIGQYWSHQLPGIRTAILSCRLTKGITNRSWNFSQRFFRFFSKQLHCPYEVYMVQNRGSKAQLLIGNTCGAFGAFKNCRFSASTLALLKNILKF